MKHSGLTLIEVLVALAVLSIAMTAIIKAASQNIRSTDYLQNKTIAMWVGQHILNEAHLGLLSLEDEDNHKTTRMLDKEWFSHIEVKETPNKRIKKIMVNVFAHHSNEESPLVTLEGYVYES